MLILTRRLGETVVIGDDVYITILGLKGNQIRLGFAAPQSLSINREEIHNRILRERQLALTTNNDVCIDEELINLLTDKFKTQSEAA